MFGNNNNNSWSPVILVKLTVPQLVKKKNINNNFKKIKNKKNSLYFMKKSSLPLSQ
jgi:hypothetical protein